MSAKPIIGRILAVEADSLRLLGTVGRGAPAPLAIRRADIERLEVSNGTSRHFGKGLLIGAGVGMLGLGLVGGSWTKDSEYGYAVGFVAGGVLGLAGGATVGFLAGGLTATERWSPLPPQIWREAGLRGPSLGLVLNVPL